MIGRSSFTKGALVMNNQAEVMATIQQLDPIYVDFSVPSYYAAILKRAMKKNPDMNIEKFPVTITFDNGEKYEHTGHIKLSEFSVDESTDTIILRTEFDNPDTQLLPGMFIRGSVMTGYHKDVYLVPSLSLSRDTLGHAFVMVLAQDGTVTVRPVKEKGLYKESWVITDGLQPGDQVIVKGLQFIRPGMKAAVMGAKPDAAPNATEAPENAKEGK
jgi:membrane fusion protein (multidrug efflux system)